MSNLRACVVLVQMKFSLRRVISRTASILQLPIDLVACGVVTESFVNNEITALSRDVYNCKPDYK